MRAALKWTAIVGGIVFVLIQLIPYGRDHSRPPGDTEPAWDSPRTRELAVAACFDCHSNETEWPWYSNIAPMSWLVYRDVERGREVLNFSRFDVEQDEADDAAEAVADGEMPPPRYTLMHPEARLSDEERAALIAGLDRTLGNGDNSGLGGSDGDNSGPGGSDGD